MYAHSNVYSNAGAPVSQGSVLAKALVKLRSFWGLSGKELAEIVGVDESVISRMKKAGGFNPNKASVKLAILLVRVFRGLAAFLGDRMDLQREWLRSYNHAFNATPLEAMQDPEGLVHVVSYLDAMRGAEA